MSLLWLLTGNWMVVSAAVSTVLSIYMLENMAFYKEILELEGIIRVKTNKIETLKLALTDLTLIHNEVTEHIRRSRARSLASNSAKF